MSASESETFEDEWECAICDGKPADAGYLENQALLRERTLLFDIDNTEWLICSGCTRHFHFNCIENIPPNATEEDIEAEHYLCDFCGWFMSSK